MSLAMSLPGLASGTPQGSCTSFSRRNPSASTTDVQPLTDVTRIGPVEIKLPFHRTAKQLARLLFRLHQAPPEQSLSDEQLLSLP
jgi:hypothetical protein